MDKQSKRLTVVIIIVLLLLTVGCTGPTAGKDDDVFAIYLAADHFRGELPDDLDGITLWEEPWLTAADIELYDYSTHIIYLKNEYPMPFPGEETPPLTYPFVVVAGGERCYLGYFMSPVSSYLPQTPTIMADGIFSFYPWDIVFIQEGFFSSTDKDVRDDERVREALREEGKLSEGIGINLKAVEIVRRGAAGTTLSYTFTVVNNDDEAIYVPDPTKMGSGLFHYYTNGIVLENSSDPRYSIMSTQEAIAPQPHDSWDEAWFTRLGGGESIERTVELGGYPEIAPGVYSGSFTYSGPHRIERDERNLGDGRIWLGQIRSNTLKITVED